MASISLNTFRMGQKHSIRHGPPEQRRPDTYQDYSYRDCSPKCRLRIWSVTHNLTKDRWVYAKAWTTQLPGEHHYIRIPRKIEIALKMLIDRDFPST